MKRKAAAPVEGKKPTKKRSVDSLADDEAKARFRKGLFDKQVLDKYTTEYASSTPYKHSVITDLIDDALLRKVRTEIKANVSFTPKETDIYKIHQSGDLANLDGLDNEALAKLPSLLALRDGLYSQTFRDYVSQITGCGPLSGRKTDMAINVYTPGCFLLCHDDVIGSRKVSYILYLTDPDTPWQAEWGGALRLFPAVDRTGKDGEQAKTPLPDPVKIIPPAWNQLSFFAVQPGESFHDVEEVYNAKSKEELEKNGGRIRMAISGWFHIPQIGEDGWVEGAEEKAARNSGLMQLQGNPDQHDRPQARPVSIAESGDYLQDSDRWTFYQADFDFLLKYMSPSYLLPDTIASVAEKFEEGYSIILPNILRPKFAAEVREYVEAQEAMKLPEVSSEIEKKGAWKVACPPHKGRYMYLQPGAPEPKISPVKELLEVLLPSRSFRVWLQMATHCKIESSDLLARRFRRGKDYTLATGYEGKSRLELNLGLTPTKGWGDDDEDEDVKDEDVEDVEDEEDDDNASEEEESEEGGKGNADNNGASPKDKGEGKAIDIPVEKKQEVVVKEEKEAIDKPVEKKQEVVVEEEKEVIDKPAEEKQEVVVEEEKEAIEQPVEKKQEVVVEEEKEVIDQPAEEKQEVVVEEGKEAIDQPVEEKQEVVVEEEEEAIEVGGYEIYMAGDDDTNEDAAIYKSSADDNILFFQEATWNKMVLVLRDSGTLRFVKYVSSAAPGDRWDISGTFEVDQMNDGLSNVVVGVLDDSEVEFKGFTSSEESDSD